MKQSVEKRQAILDAAAQVFRDSGYERASMSDIGLRTGFSKTTLYAYFGAKEALFAALAEETIDSGVASVHAALAALDEPAADLAATLGRFADAYLAFAQSPLVCTLRRVLVSIAERAGLDPRWRDLGAARIDAALAGYLSTQMDGGTLRKGDARAAARQLRALVEAPWLDQVLFDWCEVPASGQVAEDGRLAIDAFLRAWRRAAPARRGPRAISVTATP
jgi:AcrR family transcriptional regulator